MEAKEIKLEEKSFMANGKEYFFSSTMSIERFQEFERLQAHVGFGKDFKNLYDKIKEAYEGLNKSKVADAAVILSNLLNGIAQNLEERDHPVLEMCALFINYEGENLKVFDVDDAGRKIDDWKKEGYGMQSFFQLAFNFVAGFIPAYEEIIQDISEEAEKVLSSTGKSES